MRTVFEIAVVVLLVATFVASPLLIVLLWRELRPVWERYPSERRRRATPAMVGSALVLVTVTTLGIVEPWGPNSILYVVATICGPLMVLTLAGVAVRAVRETRQANARRAGTRRR